MDSISFSAAKAHLSEIMDRVECGDQVTICRHGKPIAKIVPVNQPRKPIDVDALRKNIANMKAQGAEATDSNAFWTSFRAAHRY